jgi:hypothetical protein
MRNVSAKPYRKLKHSLHDQLLFSENRAVYEIMWKNMVEPERAYRTT